MTRRRSTVAGAGAAPALDTLADLIQFLPQEYEARAPLALLEDHPDNPKAHAIAEISESVDANGWYGVIVVQRWPETPPYILAGHGRRDTLLGKGVTHAPVLWVACDPATARRIVLVDNRTTTLGGYHLPKLAAFLDRERDAGNLRGTGFDTAAVDGVLSELRESASFSSGESPLATDDEASPTSDVETASARERFALYPMEQIVTDTFAYFREHGFPYRDLPLHVQRQDLNVLAATPQEIALRSTRGYAVADSYHRHRFHAAADGKRSPVESFANDDALRHAITMALENGAAVGEKYFGTLSITRGTQACANFRPGYAMYLYRRFAAPGGVVLDPCTGYGGRLTGWIASKLGGTYVGVDPNTPTHDGNLRLAAALKLPGTIVRLLNKPFEDVAHTASLPPASCDFAFTSPPYFAKEHYSDDPTQSWVRYPTLDAWRDGFLAALMRGVYEALKPGARCLINIADVKIGQRLYPLEALTIAEGTAAGFAHEDTLDFAIAARTGQGEQPEAREPVFVFRKADTRTRRTPSSSVTAPSTARPSTPRARRK